MKTINKLTILFAILALATVSAFGQTVTLSTTTLGAALNSTATTVQLASTSTMQTQGNANQVNTVLYVDTEFLNVISVVDSTHVTVRRGFGPGVGGKQIAHKSGATVWFGNTGSYGTASSLISTNSGAQDWGTCTASSLLVLPRINAYWGTKSDCLGSLWTRTDAPGYPTLATGVTIGAGTNAVSATTMITDTGTAAMVTLTVPNGWSPGMCVQFIPGGAFTTTTAGNFSNATTAVAGKLLISCWDGSKWSSSY